jgi:hypothetical protein
MFARCQKLASANLRLATNGQNIANSKLRRDNTSGVKGVSWDGHHKSWAATIRISGKSRRIGRFKNFDDAVQSRQAAAMNAYGEFARIA